MLNYLEHLKTVLVVVSVSKSKEIPQMKRFSPPSSTSELKSQLSDLSGQLSTHCKVFFTPLFSKEIEIPDCCGSVVLGTGNA